MILIVILMIIFALLHLSGELAEREQGADLPGELFYWMAILVLQLLGTALGDFLADDSGLGFAGCALLIGSTIAAVVALSTSPKSRRCCCSGWRLCLPGRLVQPWATSYQAP